VIALRSKIERCLAVFRARLREPSSFETGGRVAALMAKKARLEACAREVLMAAAAQVFMGQFGTTIVDILKWRAQHEPNRCAYSFQSRNTVEDLTYAELDLLAKRIRRVSP